MQRLSLRRNVSWTFAGNVVYSGGQMVIFILLAKLLDAERVGLYVLGLAITTPVFIFSNFGLRPVLATDARTPRPFSHYFTLRLILTALALLVSGGIILFGGYRGSAAAIIGAIAISKAIEAISDVFYGLFQQNERLDLMARSLILRSVAMMPACAAGVYITGTAHWGIAGIILSWLAVLLAHDYPRGRLLTGSFKRGGDGRSGFLQFDRRSLLPLAGLAFPLAIATVLHSLQLQVPRYLIEHFLGVALLGIYAGMSYPMFALRTVVAALGESAAQRLARLHAEARRTEYLRLLLTLTGIGVAGGIAMVMVIAVAGRQLILLLYKPEFATHVEAFVWIAAAWAASFVLSFAGYGITALRLFRVIPVLIAMATLGTAGFGVWLIPEYGLIGAAWAVLAAEGVMLPIYAAVIWFGSKRQRKLETGYV